MTIKSQFEFIMGQEKEIIQELVLNGHECNEGEGGMLCRWESLSPHFIFSIFLRAPLWPNYMKYPNILGKSQMAGDPESPKPNVWMAHSSSDTCTIFSCKVEDCLNKNGLLQEFYSWF